MSKFENIIEEEPEEKKEIKKEKSNIKRFKDIK
jgi:hypothetical protein